MVQSKESEVNHYFDRSSRHERLWSISSIGFFKCVPFGNSIRIADVAFHSQMAWAIFQGTGRWNQRKDRFE